MGCKLSTRKNKSSGEVVEEKSLITIQPNPFEIPLIVEKTLEFIEVGSLKDLLSCRFVNSLWNREVVRLFIKLKPLKIIQFTSKEDVTRFTETFKDNLFNGLLFSLFMWNCSEELNTLDEYFINFKTLAKNTTRTLFIHQHAVKIEQEFFEHVDQQLRPKPMHPNIFEKIIFTHFPFLEILSFTDVSYKPKDHSMVFPTDDERFEAYNMSQLKSLKTISVCVFAKIEEAKMISDEVLRISPNLVKAHFFIFDMRMAETENYIQRTLKNISTLAPQVKHLEFDYSYSSEFEQGGEDFQEADFKNLNLSVFKLSESVTSIYNHTECWRFLSEYTPLQKTLKELRLKSKMTISLEEWEVENVLDYPPSGYINVTILELDLPFVGMFGNEFLLKIQSNFPALEDLSLTLLRLPSKLRFPEPMRKLKRLNFIQVGCSWHFVEEFHSFASTLKVFTPNLVQLTINIQTISVLHPESQIIAYPFFVWIGDNWLQLNRFKISIDDRITWIKGTKEKFLGICSVKDLSDESGNFTTKEISNLSFVSDTAKDHEGEMKNMEKSHFVSWLHYNFPKVQMPNNFIAEKEKQTYSKEL